MRSDNVEQVIKGAFGIILTELFQLSQVGDDDQKVYFAKMTQDMSDLELLIFKYIETLSEPRLELPAVIMSKKTDFGMN